MKADHKCKEMATGVSAGAASTDELVSAAASALENALVEQKGAINTWSEEVRRRERHAKQRTGLHFRGFVAFARPLA